jgi:hypothetical protein
MRPIARRLSLALALGVTAGSTLGGCSAPPLATRNGSCALVTQPTFSCAAAGSSPDGGATNPEALGLVGYACTGAARPDDHPSYREGVPLGMVCADRGTDDNGARAYCCSSAETSCAFNPVAICDDAPAGYRCHGSNRPEAFNAALTCGNGVRSGDLIDYCCSGTPSAPGCLQSDGIGCSPRLMGWTCQGQSMPKGEQLGPNKSRADYYYLLCPVATPAANPAYNNYCCFTPALVPEGGSCVQDAVVHGCQPGRFGFACYGRDTPEDDFPPMRCPEPGKRGVSAEGYPATLYCCDFQ